MVKLIDASTAVCLNTTEGIRLGQTCGSPATGSRFKVTDGGSAILVRHSEELHGDKAKGTAGRHTELGSRCK